jgi:hypothetical protein
VLKVRNNAKTHGEICDKIYGGINGEIDGEVNSEIYDEMHNEMKTAPPYSVLRMDKLHKVVTNDRVP